MTNLPQVINTLEMPVMNLTFRFRRLTWQDMPPVNAWMQKHKMVDRLAITAHALYNISGRDVTPDEALKVLTSVPKAVLNTVYKFYKGSLDPHRMFDTTQLWKAPDAATYRKDLEEEGSEADGVMDEVEELLTQKFGHQAVEEEKALVRQMIEGTGYAGAMKQEEQKVDTTQQGRTDREQW